MSQTATHAQSTGIVVDGYDLTTILNEATSNHNRPASVCTTFSSNGDHEYVAGPRDSMISCRGVRKGERDEYISQITQQIGTTSSEDAKKPVILCPEGYGVGKQCEIGMVGQTAMDVTVPYEGVVSISLSLMVNGGLRLATQLVSPV